MGVRIIQTNSLDLKLFQLDWDLTFAVFFMNADKTIYGRFGTRSDHRDAERDISIAGLRKAMAGALELHQAYPANKPSLAGKTGPPPRYDVPEKYPDLTRYKPTLNFSGKVAQSCMHCHQVGAAVRKVYRTARQPIPDEALFPYPMPAVLGLKLDPKEKAKVLRVMPNSPAAQAGFRAGDEIGTLQGQPLLSIADVQWVLHHTKDQASLKAEVRRGGDGETQTLSIDLAQGWRRRSDISWRTTTWDLRRMGTGGMVLEEVGGEERRRLGIAADALALRARHVGQYGQHATAKRAGFRRGDVLVAFDGVQRAMTETELLTYAVQNKKPGERIAVTIVRGDRKMELRLPMQ